MGEGVRWGHVGCMGDNSTYRFWLESLTARNNTLGVDGRLNCNISWVNRVGEFSGPGQEELAGCCEDGNEPYFSIKVEKLHVYLLTLSFSRRPVLHGTTSSVTFFWAMQKRSAHIYRLQYSGFVPILNKIDINAGLYACQERSACQNVEPNSAVIRPLNVSATHGHYYSITDSCRL
jgi:hypothetical protein